MDQLAYQYNTIYSLVQTKWICLCFDMFCVGRITLKVSSDIPPMPKVVANVFSAS